MSSYQHEVPPPQRVKPTQFQNAEELGEALGVRRKVTVNVEEFVRTRDALTSAYMGLSQSIDQAVKAYLNHTQIIINGDGALNATLLLEPFNQIAQSAVSVAQQALRAQGNDSIDPQLLQNGATEQNGEGDDKKKRKKRAYKQRDPKAPKRPLTAYFRYLGEQRPQIMEEVKANPGNFEEAGKPGDISKIATKRWNALTEAEQAPYKQDYRDALKGYDQEVAEYKKAGGEDVTVSKVDADATEIDPELEGGAEDDEEEDEVVDAKPGGEKETESEDSSDSDKDDSDAEGESDEEVDAKPAPAALKAAKKAPTTAPKSALKKGAKQAQTFSSIPSPPAPTPAPAKATSPAKKRKAAAEPEETEKSSKKKSRKSTVTAGADPVPSPAPAAPAAAPASSPPATEKAAKKSKKEKKDKKRKSSGGEA